MKLGRDGTYLHLQIVHLFKGFTSIRDQLFLMVGLGRKIFLEKCSFLLDFPRFHTAKILPPRTYYKVKGKHVSSHKLMHHDVSIQYATSQRVLRWRLRHKTDFYEAQFSRTKRLKLAQSASVKTSAFESRDKRSHEVWSRRQNNVLF